MKKLKLSIFSIFALLFFAQGSFAQKVYDIWDKATRTLTIGYAEEIPEGANEITTGKILSHKGYELYNIRYIVIDKSFAQFKPKSCANWFSDLSALYEIKGLTNVNTEDVTDMSLMFYDCERLKSLDLSSFDTKKVTNMEKMFSSCQTLKTIYVSSSKWNVNAVTTSTSMFHNCNWLYGGNGTYCQTSDITYARIDGESSKPGYFTEVGKTPFKSPTTYGLFNSETGVMKIGYSSVLPQGAIEIDTYKDWNVWEWMAEEITKPENVKRVVIDESFSNFGPYSCNKWFYFCCNLTEIEGLSNINTSTVEDLSYMFSGCRNLTSLDLSSFDTKNVYSMTEMFLYCFRLKTIFVSDKWNTNKVNNRYRDIFKGCYVLYGGKGTHCESSDIKYACIDKDGTPGYLTQVNTTPFKGPFGYGVFTESTGNLRIGFGKSLPEGAQEISLHSKLGSDIVEQSKVKRIYIEKSFADYKPFSCQSWFSSYSNVTEFVGLNNINTEMVTDMQGMFYGCSNIKYLDLSSFDTKNVTSMLRMFYDCKKLKTIFVDDNKWNVSSVTSNYYIFDGCNNLYGGNGTHCQVSDIKYACVDTDEHPGYLTLTNTEPYEPFLPYASFDSDQGILTLSCCDKKSLPANASFIDPSYINVDDYIASSITDAKNVKKVVIEEVFKHYLPISCQRWFQGCKNLTEIEGLTNLNTEDVTNMSDMFLWCENIVTLNLGSFDTKNVTDMSFMFNSCEKLKTIFVSSEWSTASVVDYTGMFSGDKKLYGGKGTHCTESDIKYACIDGGADEPGYFTKSGYNPYESRLTYGIFDSETGTLTLGYEKTLPEGAIEINAEKSVSEQWIASEITDAKNVKKIIIDKSFVDFKPTLTQYWFHACTNLTEIDGLGNVNTENVTSTRGMFYGISVSVLNLESFNTAKVTDMYEMFHSCGALKTIIVSEKWTTENVEFSKAMFRFCNNLVGGEGTKFDEEGAIDKTFARIDGGIDNPGYFSVVKAASISVDREPRLVYNLGEDFSTSGGRIKLLYNNNDYRLYYLSDATITGYDKTKVGEQILTIKYEGLETTLTVTVKNNAQTPVSNIATDDNINIWSFGHTVFVENAESEIEVVNTLGKTIIKQTPTTSRVELNISKSGIYIIKTANKTQKVVIQ